MINAAIKQRRQPPETLLDAPQLLENNTLAWRCFWDLRRGVDQLRAVQWERVALWADRYRLTLPQMEGLQQSIVVLDAVYLPIMLGKSKEGK